jgi:membrane-bound lytic murein transglycosylase D
MHSNPASILQRGAAGLLCAWLVLLPGCGLSGGGPGRAPRTGIEREDDLHRRYPQLRLLEQKLARASAHFYFGEYELAARSARDLVSSVQELRATHPDADLCDRMDHLDERAMSLLQRMADDEIEGGCLSGLASLIDSLARCAVVDEGIEIEFNAKTNHWIDYFRGNGRKHFAKWLVRVGEHRGVIEPILDEVGVPRDLLYLALIESGLNLNARSYMKAVGPWQFMAGTAAIFGLRINWWIDERKDIVAATYAAANYLKYLHEIFGAWPLALAAYNCGENRVAYAITRQRTIDYWRLDLPTQTEWFVPKFMAALAIGRDPGAYGFEPPIEAPPAFDIIEVDRPFELRAIAGAAGCPLADIKSLNPHLKRWATPPDMAVEVKVPRGAGIAAAERLASMKAAGMASIVQHHVKRGETLSSIAAQHEVSVKDLKRANEMGASNTIRAGNILLVPVKDLRRSPRLASAPSYRSPDRLPSRASLPLLAAVDGERVIRHVVKKDDTIVKIAERYNVHLADLREWNKLAHETIVTPGDTLSIRLAPARSAGSGAFPETASAGGGARSDALRVSRGGAPRETTTGDEWLVHVVRKGDTLSSISRRYNVRLSDLLAWNNKTNRSTLYPGNRIRIRVENN